MGCFNTELTSKFYAILKKNISISPQMPPHADVRDKLAGAVTKAVQSAIAAATGLEDGNGPPVIGIVGSKPEDLKNPSSQPQPQKTMSMDEDEEEQEEDEEEATMDRELELLDQIAGLMESIHLQVGGGGGGGGEKTRKQQANKPTNEEFQAIKKATLKHSVLLSLTLLSSMEDPSSIVAAAAVPIRHAMGEGPLVTIVEDLETPSSKQQKTNCPGCCQGKKLFKGGERKKSVRYQGANNLEQGDGDGLDKENHHRQNRPSNARNTCPPPNSPAGGVTRNFNFIYVASRYAPANYGDKKTMMSEARAPKEKNIEEEEENPAAENMTLDEFMAAETETEDEEVEKSGGGCC